MKIISLTFWLSIFFVLAYSQKPEDTEDWSRRPEVITPGTNAGPPSDALVLLGDGSDISNWEHRNGEPVKWLMNNGELTVVGGTGDILTKAKFGDVQLHIEWRSPVEVKGDGQGRGNSGIFLMDKYEIQVLDSYQNETYYNGQAGSVYKQHIPLVNACKPPNEWQTYDIIFTAPKFNEDQTQKSPAYITVIHNGVLIQNHVEIQGGTRYIGKPKYDYHDSSMPVRIQDHGDAVSFRNIWIREL
jgi:hypothetical protein